MTRTNSTGALEVDRGLARNHRVAVFVAALVAMAACFALLPGATLSDSLVQTAALATIAVAAVGVSRPAALGGLRARPMGQRRGFGPWIAYVLLVGVVGGAAAFALTPERDAFGVVPALVAQVVALCLLTGVFEEGVFRVLAVDAFAPALGGGQRGALAAAAVSSVLFGALHVSLGDSASAVGAVAIAQTILKPVQAALFGFFMAALYVAARNLWQLAAVHAAFNLAYTGPLLLMGGFQQTYVTGDPLDLALLAATTLLLIPPALAAHRRLRPAS